MDTETQIRSSVLWPEENTVDVIFDLIILHYSSRKMSLKGG